MKKKTGWVTLKSGVLKRGRFYMSKYPTGWWLRHTTPFRTWGPFETINEAKRKRVRLIRKWREEN